MTHASHMERPVLIDFPSLFGRMNHNEPKISWHTRMKSVPVASVASGFYHSYRLYASTYGALVHHGELPMCNRVFHPHPEVC